MSLFNLYKKRLVKPSIFCMFSMLILVADVYAHPHAWIYIHTSFVVEDGKIVALKQDWRYDHILTEAIYDGLSKESESGEPDLAGYAEETISDLEQLNYYLDLRQNEDSVSIGKAINFSSYMKDDRIHLKFTAPLKEFIDIKQGNINLAVYDPTYFIEMLQFPEAPPNFEGSEQIPCELVIEYPEPSEEDYLKALQLDQGAKAEPEFGSLFAEKVLVECQ